MILRIFRRQQLSGIPLGDSGWQPGITSRRSERALDMYLLPRTMQETQRLDFQHYLLRQVFKGNAVAPIGPAIRSILDVGCGTGRWPQEMALQLPHAQVVGLDLEQTRQILLPGVADNYRFVQGNLLSGLPFANQSFDYVHQRFLVAGLPAKQWPFVIGELVRATCAGGWVELVEAGNTFLQAGPATQQFLTWWIALSQSRGIDASVVEQLGGLLHHAGLQHIQTRAIDLPVGGWGKGEQRRIGDLLAKDMLAGFPSLKGACCTLLHLPSDEFDQVMRALPEEWAKLHTQYRFYVAYGRRSEIEVGQRTN